MPQLKLMVISAKETLLFSSFLLSFCLGYFGYLALHDDIDVCFLMQPLLIGIYHFGSFGSDFSKCLSDVFDFAVTLTVDFFFSLGWNLRDCACECL